MKKRGLIREGFSANLTIVDLKKRTENYKRLAGLQMRTVSFFFFCFGKWGSICLYWLSVNIPM